MSIFTLASPVEEDSPRGRKIAEKIWQNVSHIEDYFHQRTYAWWDVKEKAKRIRGGADLDIVFERNDYFESMVLGDHDIYDAYVQIWGAPSSSYNVSAWGCSCPWGYWAWRRGDTYFGRMCSHALATYYEAQSRMFSKSSSLQEAEDRAMYSSWCRSNQLQHKSHKNVMEYARVNKMGMVERNRLHSHVVGVSPVRYIEATKYSGKSRERRANLTRMAGRTFSPAEQDALVNESGEALQRANLKLQGTHYLDDLA